MSVSNNVNSDPSTVKPTWGFVTVLVLTIVAELFQENIRSWLHPAPQPILYADCIGFCDGAVQSVTRDGCWCKP